MARKRRNETNSSGKSSAKYVPVRKSSRQIAKKQLEEKKINGDVSRASRPDDIQDVGEDGGRTLSKKSQTSSRKHTKHKSPVNEDSVCISGLSYKRDTGESDSQDGSDNVIDRSEKLSPEDVRQMVVGNASTELPITLSVSDEIEVWPEDVIEETIICEEMEVEEDNVDNYTLEQENPGVERVLAVGESNEEGKNFMEYTVIENLDRSGSVIAHSNKENTLDSRYRAIQGDIGNSCVTEVENSLSSSHTDTSSSSNNENCNKIMHSLDRNRVEEKKSTIDCSGEDTTSDKNVSSKRTNIPKQRSYKGSAGCLKEESSSSSDFLEESVARSSEQKLNEQSLRDTRSKASKNDIFDKIDDKLAVMRISESSKEIQKLVNDLSNTESIDSPMYTSESMDKISAIHDDESNSSILDKMEQIHRQSNATHFAENSNIFKNQDGSLNSTPYDEKMEVTNRLLPKSSSIQSQKSSNRRQKVNSYGNIEEIYRSVETDSKTESEDIKSSSSSENSNDTLLSTGSCKVRDNDTKNHNNFSSDGDKKTEFRSRSGSTDTTGSESGSNSSAVRRSSRIRSIGLMKQRSRGRGLVVKPNTDATKANCQQERDKLPSSVSFGSQDFKSKSDNGTENQSNKENSDNKTTIAYDTLAPIPVSCTAGYDSDSSKPVKVKSRWRRSSELEMGGGSGIGSSIGSGVNSMVSSTIASDSSSRLMSKSSSGSSGLFESTETTPRNISVSVTNNQSFSSIKIENSSDSSSGSNNSSLVISIPKTVGAKIPLPMVLETKDREMEERLSQFEHLRENLYLTERYTNKETKRMVCDCFLTDEEIERGELGCGEDCLNRLLMIECGPRCVVGDRCTNKRFQNCEYAKCEVFRTEKKGFGLRAMVDLDAGEFIMEYVGEVVDPKDFRRRAKEYSKDKNKHYYFMALKSDQIIDATMKGNISRFINHSCDPNSETQKWTVNGELRIGFFNKKCIAAGEEITFDYHFQRYGKEAQKCYCEAPNCRGWIGDTPEEEKEKIEKKEKREKDVRKKKEEKKLSDYMEDEDLEEEIDKLCSGGLKNRAHTLTLSRLMVRSRELVHRTRLLKLIQSGEQPCRRLFLDYHGLRLIWSYVMDISMDDSEEAQQFRLEVSKTLNTLPIPNKTMLMDSKIYGVIEKWAKRVYLSPNTDSPEDDQAKSKSSEEQNSNYSNVEKKVIEYPNELPERFENNGENSFMLNNDTKHENVGGDQSLISELATKLLTEWSNLKEVFRIPKKERIEQMKEHEREADRGYREELEKEEKRSTSYDRPRPDRYGRTETDKRTDRRRATRDSPESEHGRTKDKRTPEERSLVPIPRMTKYERRQLFALKVAKEEEERQRRQQQESWQEHEARCLALGIDPHSTAMMDPQTGYPVFYNPSLGQWQHYPMQGSQPLSGHSQTGMVPQLPSDVSPGIPNSIIPTGATSTVYPLSQTSVFGQAATSYSLLPSRQYPDNLVSVHTGTSSVPMQTQSIYNIEKLPPDQQFPTVTPTIEPTVSRAPQPEIPPIDLPPKWKSAVDARGRTYYYHAKERISQWLPPPPDHIGVQPDSSSTSESSEESSSSNEDEDDVEVDDNTEEQKSEGLGLECGAENTFSSSSPSSSSSNITCVSRHSASKKSSVLNVLGTSDGDGCSGSGGSGSGTGSGGTSMLAPEPKKRRDGLVQERIISPRREEDRMDHKTYKEIKDKLRRQKERARLKEHIEKQRKHRRGNKSKSHSRHALKLQSSDASSMSERKIKDTFRINMANVMVHFLNPYRKNDCKQGRITNTEDFKHLARKLTHFVLAKELKHCKSVDELQCNENVKHKAKDFVRKYMSKFGAVYQKSTDED